MLKKVDDLSNEREGLCVLYPIWSAGLSLFNFHLILHRRRATSVVLCTDFKVSVPRGLICLQMKQELIVWCGGCSCRARLSDFAPLHFILTQEWVVFFNSE
jgi:hypothetical protein